MNFVTVCAQTAQEPIEVYTSATSTAVRCPVLLPPIGNKAPTQIEFNAYGKQAERFLKVPKKSLLYIHGAKLRYDIDSRTFSLHGVIFTIVNESFPIFNTVILSGRCIKDIDTADARAFKTTAEGLMITNQSLSVSTGRNQSDIFNFYAMNTADDKFNQAELLCNSTRKGTGLTIQGRLVTDTWLDKETKEQRTNTKIQLIAMTLPPKTNDSVTSNKPATTEASSATESATPSLWGGKTVDDIAEPWGHSTGANLPDLPPSFNEEHPPF